MTPDACFEQALREYRERSWCPDDFADLPTASQDSIVERACQIQEAEWMRFRRRLHQQSGAGCCW